MLDTSGSIVTFGTTTKKQNNQHSNENRCWVFRGSEQYYYGDITRIPGEKSDVRLQEDAGKMNVLTFSISNVIQKAWVTENWI